MPTTKPTLELLRSLSDEHVLRALMAQRQATRAEIAAVTGLSKPTVSESVRRLDAAGAVVDTGARTTGRGRVGTYYALPGDTGRALVVGIAPEGIVAEAVDVYGEVVARAQAAVDRSPASGEVARALQRVAGGVGGPLRLAVVSAADPVDRRTGRLVALPDAPFLLGELDPPALLADVVEGPVTVDNDVNWAARAEHGRVARDFVYVYLGEGVGCAVVSDGEVRRGHAGVAGEIAHVLTAGPGGVAMPLTDVFAALGLRRAGSTAIDVSALLRDAERLAGALAQAVGGVLSAAVALADPAVVLLGGPWGRDPRILAAVAREFARSPRHVPVEAATVDDEPALTGARETALEHLRDAIVAAAPRQRPR
ncbi:ROK family transcriptional regulator [Solirubrobacter ginsenosidimutans]|uniref:ROK family transcriptional regulator n=1 Tax=Solirubrobacter ginsenosidimutans TaxID=490573 RepID=A0A9X3N1H2_9ACTN|nr:ROK family transcriptional regulator [Solirubrobacter ginsenosidimutans]MDA0166497.1 ROK family transcriptional regulator [Solirubrobacter ginsenosidimutans]